VLRKELRVSASPKTQPLKFFFTTLRSLRASASLPDLSLPSLDYTTVLLFSCSTAPFLSLVPILLSNLSSRLRPRILSQLSSATRSTLLLIFRATLPVLPTSRFPASP
jgi:hypothetical protein